MKKFTFYLVPALLTGFALLTFYLSASVIFDLFGMREVKGNYVLFVVWANFLSSFLYLIAVYGILNLKNWTYKILGLSFLILTAAFIGFLFIVQMEGKHETHTLVHMTIRIILTCAFMLYAFFTINKNSKRLTSKV
jgi:hypothetical protein